MYDAGALVDVVVAVFVETDDAAGEEEFGPEANIESDGVLFVVAVDEDEREGLPEPFFEMEVGAVRAGIVAGDAVSYAVKRGKFLE